MTDVIRADDTSAAASTLRSPSMSRALSRSALRVTAATALALTPILMAGPAQAADTATVTVVHGIPDTPVDVYVDGTKALPNFTFKTVTKPIALPAGSH